MGKCRLLASCISEAYILKRNSWSLFIFRLYTAFLVCKRGLCVQNLVKTYSGSQCFGNSHDQVCQGDQCNEDLVHIVYKGNYLTLCKDSHRYLFASIPQNSDNSKVHDDGSSWIQKCGNFAGSYLYPGIIIICFGKFLVLFFLSSKSPYYSGTYMVFPCNKRNPVQRGLCLLINRHCSSHNSIDHNGNKRHCNEENKSNLHINGKGHDNSTNYNKRRTEKQTQYHVYTCLSLVYIVGDPCDKSGRSQLVQLPVGKLADMCKHLPTKSRTESHRCFRRKVLGSKRTYKSDYPKKYHEHALMPDVGIVLIFDTDIHNVRNYQWHDQLKCSLQHLK